MIHPSLVKKYPTNEPPYSIKGKQVEFKTFRFQVKSIDEDAGTVTGYLSTFGNVDLQKDRVIKGAFKKTLSDAYSRKAGGRKYLFAILWMHDPDHPIGGFTEAKEDANGLLVTAQLDITVNAAGIPNNPTATMVFSGFKAGYIDEMSMGYIAVQRDYDDGVRNLKEVQLIEGSAITMLMAANPEALVPASGVKSVAIKGASGKTSWPLGDRNAAWDNGAAHNRIVAWATDSAGDLDTAKMQSVHFWYDDSAPDKITSYKLLFCDVIGGSVKAMPRAIFACTGSHGIQSADIPDGDMDGVKVKIAAYYSKMAKQFDDDSITPPWEDSGKRRRMSQRKDFTTIHQAGQASDTLEDWCDLINELTQAMFQIFGMSDTPQADMQTCLAQFNAAVLDEWEPKAEQSEMGQYLVDQGYCADAPYVPYSMQAGNSYGYMARAGRASSKAGRTISAATQTAVEQHQQEMKDLLTQHKAMVADSVSAMQQKVSDLTQLWADEGQGPAYSDDNDDSSTNGKSRFARREPTTRSLPRPKTQPEPSTVSDEAVAELASLLA